MSESSTSLPESLRARLADGPIAYRDYIDYALYDSKSGYYTADRRRVGRRPDADFYTAESLGPVFARLVAAASQKLLGEARAAKAAFVEIAAEPEASLLDGLDSHPFGGSKIIRHGETIELSGENVVFANEWLDALPFHRLIFTEGRWRERGVRLHSKGFLEDCRLECFTPPVAAVAGRLPKAAPEAYELDLPLAAERALADLVAQDWNGLLLLFDYGKSWRQLTEACPAGTARAYRRHEPLDDLLGSPPGQADMTCDVCWDPLEACLREAGFDPVGLETQESFLVHHAGAAAEAIVRNAAGGFSKERQTLMELVHPAHMGRRFQVLWGVR